MASAIHKVISHPETNKTWHQLSINQEDMASVIHIPSKQLPHTLLLRLNSVEEKKGRGDKKLIKET